VRIVDRALSRAELALANARKRYGLLDHAWRTLERFNDVDAGRLAAAISYYGFFAAFSLAAVVYSVLGRILGTSDSGLIGTANRYLSQTLPWVVDTAKQVGRGEVTVLGLVALIVAGVGWVEALRSSQRAIWLIEQHPGNWFIRRIVDFGMLIGLGMLLGLSLAMTMVVDRVLDWLAPNTTLGKALVHSSGPVLELAVNFVLAAAVLLALPRLRLSPRRLLPSAVVVAIGIQLLNSLGTWFIRRTEERPAYQLVAGTVGLLIYLYLLNQLILLGAALAATSHRGTVVDLAGPTQSVVDMKPADNVGEPHDPGPAEPR
jgi:membrane protein